jgi:hypothetical protein
MTDGAGSIITGEALAAWHAKHTQRCLLRVLAAYKQGHFAIAPFVGFRSASTVSRSLEGEKVPGPGIRKLQCAAPVPLAPSPLPTFVRALCLALSAVRFPVGRKPPDWLPPRSCLG